MNLPGTDTERAVDDARRRRVVVLVVLAAMALGVAGVTASSLVSHDTRRVITSAASPGYPAGAAALASDTTTTGPWRSTTITPAPVPVASAVAPSATTPSTVGYAPPSTAHPSAPITTPPTSAAPKTTITVAAAGVQIRPSTAMFPSTPPPYWPMPIVTITITNTGGVAVRSIVVHPVGVYSVPSSTCTTLTPGRSCVAEIQFCPTSPSHYLNTLVVTGQDAVTGAPLHTGITLDGTAT